MTKSNIEIKRDENGKAISIAINNLGLATKSATKEYVVFCPSLKVLGYSNKSQKEALNDFEENLSLFFSVHERNNTLHDALLKFKWTNNSNKKSLKLKNTFPKFATETPEGLAIKNFNIPLKAA